MSKINVLIGSITRGNNNATLNTTQKVQFEGERLATHRMATSVHKNNIATDSRGIVETLYKSGNGRLIVHVKEWSHLQGEPWTHRHGEPMTYSLCQVTAAELQQHHPFLAAVAGMGRPLTLDEALDLIA